MIFSLYQQFYSYIKYAHAFLLYSQQTLRFQFESQLPDDNYAIRNYFHFLPEMFALKVIGPSKYGVNKDQFWRFFWVHYSRVGALLCTILKINNLFIIFYTIIATTKITKYYYRKIISLIWIVVFKKCTNCWITCNTKNWKNIGSSL